MKPQETLQRFDAFLAGRNLRLEAVVIGGAALALLHVIDRETRDVDVLHPTLSEAIKGAAKAFAEAEREAGRALDEMWLNDEPGDLAKALPSGWEDRLQPAFGGQALDLKSLGRGDLLRTKLFALCDRGLDLADCLALQPTERELEEARPWVKDQDANADWPEHVDEVLDDLGRRMGHGV